jgi:rod shape-determining protein MreB and related proteins
MSLFETFTQDVAVDLGCSTVRVYVRGKGLVAVEPNLVAARKSGPRCGEVLSVGVEAAHMIGRTPQEVAVVRPVRGGAIADLDCMEAMLRHLAHETGFLGALRRPRLTVPVPLDLSSVERRAVEECGRQIGAREVRMVPKVVAAAIGLGLSEERPEGHFILDIGGGTTEAAVVSISGVVSSRSLRMGGASLNDALVNYVRRKFNLLIGDETAERLKLVLGSAHPTDLVRKLEVRGRDLISGVPKAVEIGSEETREALEECVGEIVAVVTELLEGTPPEVASDIFSQGLILIGGGSLLGQLDLRLREATGLVAVRADDATNVVVLGAGKILEDAESYAGLFPG